jgi:hypothetical protein
MWRAITPEMALRIGRALGTGARLWLAMQRAYDLNPAERQIIWPNRTGTFPWENSFDPAFHGDLPDLTEH